MIGKKKIVNELQQQEYFAKILKLENLGVLFCGCMDNTSGYLSSIEDIEKIYNKVVNMREETLQFIFDSNDSVLLSDLPIALLFKKKS